MKQVGSWLVQSKRLELHTQSQSRQPNQLAPDAVKFLWRLDGEVWSSRDAAKLLHNADNINSFYALVTHVPSPTTVIDEVKKDLKDKEKKNKDKANAE